MALCGFLFNDLSKGASITGSATATGLGYDRLQDTQPRHRCRMTPGSSHFIIDIGSVQNVDVAALISTDFDATTPIRLRMSATDPNATTALVYTSAGSAQPGFTDTRYNGQVVVGLPAPVGARYIRWDFTSGAPYDVGLAPCGLLTRFRNNFIYGMQEGRIDVSPRDRNPDTGAEFTVQRPQSRVKLIGFDFLSDDDVRDSIDDIETTIGVAGDLLYVEDSDADFIDCARDSIWGSYRQTGQDQFSQLTYNNIWGRSFRLQERL